jgi:hypothetical protein
MAIKRIQITVNPFVESLKEPLRLAILGAVSAFITILLDQITTLPTTEITIILTFFLRWLDKWFHERSKVEPSARLSGLVPF